MTTRRDVFHMAKATNAGLLAGTKKTGGKMKPYPGSTAPLR
jgi:hypothetical protein